MSRSYYDRQAFILRDPLLQLLPGSGGTDLSIANWSDPPGVLSLHFNGVSYDLLVDAIENQNTNYWLMHNPELGTIFSTPQSLYTPTIINGKIKVADTATWTGLDQNVWGSIYPDLSHGNNRAQLFNNCIPLTSGFGQSNSINMLSLWAYYIYLPGLTLLNMLLPIFYNGNDPTVRPADIYVV
jgi:hypothetical protein